MSKKRAEVSEAWRVAGRPCNQNKESHYRQNKPPFCGHGSDGGGCGDGREAAAAEAAIQTVETLGGALGCFMGRKMRSTKHRRWAEGDMGRKRVLGPLARVPMPYRVYNTGHCKTTYCSALVTSHPGHLESVIGNNW